ncbi:MAG: hypothetical protein GY943_38110 [Chloroflexi bacterium]|nr:hypothetical protein [Chloroflexota bacterium]
MTLKNHQEQCEIAIINGTLGVGKTETSWAIMNAVQPAAVIDLDYLYAFKPKDYADKTQQAHVYEAAVILITHHRNLKIDRFIINGVFETPSDLIHLLHHLEAVTTSVSTYRLVCDPGEVQRRVRLRNEPNYRQHMQRTLDMMEVQNQSALAGFIGKPVDTTELSLDAAANLIMQDMQRCGYWLSVAL